MKRTKATNLNTYDYGYDKLLVFSWYRDCIPYFRLCNWSNRLQASNKKRRREKMIFRKLKREFPQFANMQANKVSDLTHAQRVQIAKALWNSNTIRDRKKNAIHNILTQDPQAFFKVTYQAMNKGLLRIRLYKALKKYYDE